MGFSHLLGQPGATETIKRALLGNRVHHAYIFAGPPGVGKAQMAAAFAQALVCEGSEPLGCEECDACKLATALSESEPQVPKHPDVIWIKRTLYPKSLVGATEGTAISVEQIRRVIHPRAVYPPHRGQALVFIIHEAHELSLAASNSLLKVLEEPRNKTHFVLLTHRPSDLLDTLRSRSQTVRFGPLSTDTLQTILRKAGLPTEVATLAQGSAEQALALADPAAAAAREALWQSFQDATDHSDLCLALDVAREHGRDRQWLQRELSLFAEHVAGLARGLVNTDSGQAEKQAQSYEAIVDALAALESNMAPTLALERMFIKLRTYARPQ